MKIVVDTCAIIAVLLNEPERPVILERTTGHELLGPESVPFEIGNALSAMFKRKALTLDKALAVLDTYRNLRMEYVPVGLHRSIEIANQLNVYAYDAYLMECAQRHNASLLTLDRRLAACATTAGIPLIEIST